MLLSTPRSPSFKRVDPKQLLADKTLSIAEIPTKVKLKINSIEPNTYDTAMQIYVDGRPIVETQKNEYLFDIRDSNPHSLKIKIQDKVRELFYEEEITAKI